MTDYFDGLSFRSFGEIPGVDSTIYRSDFSYYGIQYTHTGRLLLAVDGDSPVLCDGPCLFITSPGHNFSYGPPSGETKDHAFLCFSGPRVDRYLETNLLDASPGKIFRIPRSEHFHSVLREIFRILSVPSVRVNPRAVLMLEDLLLQIHEQPERNLRVNALCRERISALRRDIVDHPDSEFHPEREAGELSISVQHFRRLFRDIVGCPFNRFVMECRLNSAETMLLSSPLPVAEIAHRCGFPDEFYFSRQFRRFRGKTPSSCRESFDFPRESGILSGK